MGALLLRKPGITEHHLFMLEEPDKI